MFRWSLSALVLSVALTSLAFAHDPKQKKEAAPPSAEEQKMMEAWMKAMTPGENHKALEAFVGTWDTKVKAWMQPGAPAVESTGVSTNSWILGGRFIEQRFEGSFMGQPFTGLGYTGYDNIAKKFIGSWMDNMSTGAMNSTGMMEKDGKTFTFVGSMLDPMTGKASDVKEKITVIDADTHTMEMWAPGPDGKMYKNMEITYTRRK
jgi:hypothetical protein